MGQDRFWCRVRVRPKALPVELRLASLVRVATVTRSAIHLTWALSPADGAGSFQSPFAGAIWRPPRGFPQSTPRVLSTREIPPAVCSAESPTAPPALRLFP